jgi:hypothetical protein
MAGTHEAMGFRIRLLIAASFVAVISCACGTSPGTNGAAANVGRGSTTTTPAPQITATTNVHSAAETSYKGSAQAVTIEQLLEGRVNAPPINVGTIVNFIGRVERFLYSGPGQVSGLILRDTTSTSTVCVQLSDRASAADVHTPHFMNSGDAVAIWGVWQGPASVDSYPAGSTTCPGVVSETYLSDTTTGRSDDQS